MKSKYLNDFMIPYLLFTIDYSTVNTLAGKNISCTSLSYIDASGSLSVFLMKVDIILHILETALVP